MSQMTGCVSTIFSPCVLLLHLTANIIVHMKAHSIVVYDYTKRNIYKIGQQGIYQSVSLFIWLQDIQCSWHMFTSAYSNLSLSCLSLIFGPGWVETQ